MPVTPGTKLGPYEIVALLGAGGMGEVYKARDTRLDRTVAIKILPDTLAADPQFRERFDREARAISQVEHPHICALYDVGEQNGTAYLVMQHLEGETLAHRLTKGALPLDQALTIAISIASALDKAHRAGIVHRDLKPGNIMLTKAGAKLLDFGLAKSSAPVVASAGLSVMPTAPPNLTEHGTILGTFQYMAPEQLEGGDADARTDIFALGAVLFEMLTGKKAFEGRSQASLIGAIMHATPPPIAASVPLTPPSLDHIVGRCLAKDPDERWQSAGDLKQELQWAAEGGSMSAPTPRAMTRHRREYVAWSLAAVAMVVATGASVLYLRAPQSVNPVVRYAVAPPYGATRTAGHAFAMSPNGQMVAFRATDTNGTSRIFTRRMDQAEPQPVAGTDHATVPFWSPDSRSLAFYTEGALYRTDLDGSAPRRLCDVPGPVNLFSTAIGTWGTSGVIVFASIGTGLWRVPDSGGTPTLVTSLDAAHKEVSHTSPSFLPDGRHLLFLALSGQTRGVIWSVAIDDPVRTRVAESSGGAQYADGWLLTTSAPPRNLEAQPFDAKRLTVAGAPQPVRDRLAVANTNGSSGFSVSLNGELAVDRPSPIIHQLTWVDRAGRVLRTLGPAAVIPDFSLAPDETRVAANVIDPESFSRNLWMFDPQRDEGTRLTFQINTRRPMWSLDGRRIYFTQGPTFELRSLTLGATDSETFANPAGFVHFEDVTRDGRYFVLKSPYAEISRVWIQRVGVPGERRLLVQAQFAATQARVSPDGRWLAFTMALPRGPEVFVQPFDRPGDRIQVSRAGGSGAVWRADSRELYYETRDALMAATMIERSGALEVGTPQKLFAVRTQGYVTNQPHNIEVAANGQKFLVNAIVGNSDNAPIEVTLNWMAGLKK
jgi:dipeptidyl aminopeptidase/acylaminoacyl peptidase